MFNAFNQRGWLLALVLLMPFTLVSQPAAPRKVSGVVVTAQGQAVAGAKPYEGAAPWSGVNLAIDNLTDKRYFETRNFFTSRLRPQDAVIERVHATSGFSRALTIGLSLRMGER